MAEKKESTSIKMLVDQLGTERRVEAKYAILGLGSRAVPELSQALFDKSFGTDARRSCAELLGQIGDPSAAPALRKALSDENTIVRAFAALALQWLDYKKPAKAQTALEKVREQIKGEKDAQVKKILANTREKLKKKAKSSKA